MATTGTNGELSPHDVRHTRFRAMLDFLDIDSLLSEEERAVRESVRAFVDERVLPIIGTCYVE